MKVKKTLLSLVVSMLFLTPSLWAESTQEDSDRWELPLREGKPSR